MKPEPTTGVEEAGRVTPTTPSKDLPVGTMVGRSTFKSKLESKASSTWRQSSK